MKSNIKQLFCRHCYRIVDRGTMERIGEIITILYCEKCGKVKTTKKFFKPDDIKRNYEIEFR